MKKIIKKLARKILSILPNHLREEVIRSFFQIPTQISENLVFKIADTKQELEDSFKLVYDAYILKGYCHPSPHQMRATLYHALPTTTTLVAKDRDKVIGTLTIVRDNRLKLPLEKVFDVSNLRKNSRRLAEITSMVIHPDYRRHQGGHVLLLLLKLMYEYSTKYFGVNHLIVSVDPKDSDFYKTLLLFESVPDTGIKEYLGAPTECLHLNLSRALFDYERVYSLLPAQHNLFYLFVHQKISQIRLPQRQYHKIDDPLVDIKYFQEFFCDKLKLIDDPQQIEKRRIESYLRHTEGLRFNPRLEVDAPAKIFIQSKLICSTVLIKDISRNGLRAHFEGHLPLSPVYEIHIEISSSLKSVLTARPIWLNPDRGVGFEILTADDKWTDFINASYKDHFIKAA